MLLTFLKLLYSYSDATEVTPINLKNVNFSKYIPGKLLKQLMNFSQRYDLAAYRKIQAA